jgi:hypothetical protein
MNDFIKVPVTIGADSVKWDDIELFRRRFAVLWSNFKDLKLGRLVGSFSRQPDGRHTGGFDDLPEDHRLKGLYVDFRHFYLNDETTNVERIANHLSTLTTSGLFRRFIREEKKRLRSPFIEDGWFEHKGQPLSTRRFLDVWFNAEIFHSDSEDAETLREWRAIFTNETAKSMLFMAVSDSILIIRNINWVAAELSRSNMNLRIPKSALQAIAADT